MGPIQLAESSKDPVEQHLMKAIVTGEFWMKGCCENPTLANHYRVVVNGGKDFNSIPDFGDPGRPDEYCAERLVQALDGELLFERLVLSAKGISLDNDIKGSQQRLLALGHFSGEEDHPGTCSIDRQAIFDPLPQRIHHPETHRQFADGGGFPSGDDQRLYRVEIRRGAHFLSFGPEGR
jgi:hypothetical protein